MSAPTSPLRRGGQRAAEEAAKRKSSSSYGLWEYHSLDAPPKGEVLGGTGIYRLVTDEPDFVEAKVHSFIPTKPAPQDKPEDKKWRPNQDATCRYTSTEAGTLYPDCYICDEVVVVKNGKEQKPFPATRLYAVAVERERVKATEEHVAQGLIEAHEVGSYPDSLIRDVMVEKEIGGKTVKIPKFVMFSYGMKNFYDKLLGFQNVYGNVVDRDYQITRKGAGTDTDYQIVALEVQRDADGKKVDPRSEKYAEHYSYPGGDKTWIEVMTEVVLGKATDEYYGFYFDPSQHISWAERFPKREDGDKAETSTGTTSQPTTSVTQQADDAAQETNNQATVEAMRARMRQKANA